MNFSHLCLIVVHQVIVDSFPPLINKLHREHQGLQPLEPQNQPQVPLVMLIVKMLLLVGSRYYLTVQQEMSLLYSTLGVKSSYLN